MKIALGQINPLVGDIQGNTERILRAAEGAAAAGADVLVAPELAVLGYPPKDLVLKEAVIRRNMEAVERIAAASGQVAIVVGFVRPVEAKRGRSLHNAVAVCVDGRIAEVHVKRLLPTYDVFDECRYFEPGDRPGIVSLPGFAGAVGLTVCEDLWNYELIAERQPYHTDAVADLVAGGAGLLINISASPYSLGKHQKRTRIFAGQARRHGVPLLYVNQVGGNDDLIFDGASAVFATDGRVAAQAKAFEEDLLIVDLDRLDRARKEPFPEDVASVHDALVLGTRDYVNKCGFSQVVLGLSGGIDSAVTAGIAVAALGAQRVHGVALPSRYSSEHSIADAKALADNLGMDFSVLPIDDVHGSMEQTLKVHLESGPLGIAEENIQARIRGNILMALSNKRNWLLLTTGNKSELAVGYCTLYGDMCGGLAVLSDVPKMLVYELARYINRRAGRELIPQRSITKPPSAELKPGQTDQDTLPPYEVLDEILRLYIEEEQDVEAIASAGFDSDVVRRIARAVDLNEYKRKQAAVGLKVTSRAFGTGRRMPIAARSH